MLRWTLTLTLGFLTGVLAQSLLSLGWPFALWCFVLAAGFLVLSLVKPAASLIFKTALVLVLAAGFGVLRLELAQSADKSVLAPLVGQIVTLDGVIAAEPDDRENSAKLSVKLVDSRVKILLTLPRHHGFVYGDKLRFTGQLVEPKNFITDTGRQFDYVDYLLKDDIFYQMFYPQVEKIGGGEGFWLQEKLFGLKNSWLEHINALLPEPHSSLAGGLVVGAREGLGEKWQMLLRRVGIIHIVVLSGYNVTLVAENITKFFSFFLSRYLGLGLGSLGIVLFTLMVGVGPSVVRASVMALIAILARFSGRLYSVGWALLLAVFLMVLHNPKILVWDPGFQLSVLATVGLIYFSPTVEKRLNFVPVKFGLRSIVSSTLATQLFVLPWLLYKMGQLSLVALPVNILVLFFIPVTMFLAFAAGLVGFLSLIIAKPLAWLAYVLLAYELKVAELFGALPFAAVALQSFPLTLVLLLYAGYGYIIHRSYQRNKGLKLLVTKQISKQ